MAPVHLVRCRECERFGRTAPVLAFAVSERTFDSLSPAVGDERRIAVFLFDYTRRDRVGRWSSLDGGGGIYSVRVNVAVSVLTDGDRYALRTPVVELLDDDRYRTTCPHGHRTQITRAQVVREAVRSTGPAPARRPLPGPVPAGRGRSG